MTLTTSLILAVTTGCVSYMNFVMGRNENRSAKSDGLKSDSSWGLRIVSLSHAREKTKNIFLYFFTELKTIYLSYSIYDTHSLHLAGSYGVLRFWSKKFNLIWPFLSDFIFFLQGDFVYMFWLYVTKFGRLFAMF